ncbi:MAG TPA: PorP/SprF family type IX secretion system membrane protein [Bacteroidales bacterium]|nr:PorP/SprF family type IX secretion system membrane protein [Bacteroidales bacterium]
MKLQLKKSVILFLAILLIQIAGTFAQEKSVYKQYYLTPFIVNPAFTGSNYYPGALLSVRRQWVGIPESPATYFLSGNYRIGSYDFYDPKGFVNKGALELKDRMGLGAALYNHNYGPENLLGGNISYAYHVPLSSKYELSFGMSVIANYHSLRSDMLKPDQPDDPYLLNGNDPVFRMNFNLGILLHSNNNYIGFSTVKLLPDANAVNETNEFLPSYYLMAGQKIKINRVLLFEPSITAKKLGDEPISADIYAKLYVNRLHWTSISYSTNGNINIIVAVHVIKMVHAGYSYEYTLGKIGSFNYGTHNIFLGINLGLFQVEGIRTSIIRKI